MTTLDPGDPLVGVSTTNELRQRKTSSLDTSSSSSSSDSHQSTRTTTTTEQGPFGKTPDGTGKLLLPLSLFLSQLTLDRAR